MGACLAKSALYDDVLRMLLLVVQTDEMPRLLTAIDKYFLMACQVC